MPSPTSSARRGTCSVCPRSSFGRSPGWNRIAISRIETADRLPSLDRVFVLADALETAAPDLRELAHALKMSYFA
jgi:hypothetical protein